MLEELSSSVEQRCKYCHLYELSKTKYESDCMTLLDCNVQWSLKQSIIVLNYLFIVPKRSNRSIVQDCITCKYIRLLCRFVRALAQSLLEISRNDRAKHHKRYACKAHQ